MKVEEQLAARFLQSQRGRSDLDRVLNGYAGAVPLCIYADRERWRERSQLGERRFGRPDQQPRFYFPHLSARPWHDDSPWARALEENFAPIREEFRAVERHLRAHPQTYLVLDGKWSLFTLFRDGRKWQENCALCPLTTRVVEALPLCHHGHGVVYFSIMDPGTRIKAHCGLTNARIRHHLGIEVPGGAQLSVAGETRSWEEGRCLAFDDSFLHEVRHEGARRRVVLIVDTWHPELSAAEAEFVAEVQRLFYPPRRPAAQT